MCEVIVLEAVMCEAIMCEAIVCEAGVWEVVSKELWRCTSQVQFLLKKHQRSLFNSHFNTMSFFLG